MSFCLRVSEPEVRVKTERVKVLRVIGEQIAQIVVEGSLSINAIKIDRIHAEIREAEDHIFINKVVKQGIIHKQIFYVDLEGIVRHTTEDLPFMVSVDIPGVDPNNGFLDVQNHQLDIATDFSLVPATVGSIGTLTQKVVAHVLIKASEWTQLDVITKVDVFPKVNCAGRIACCLK
jgi:hypothetical protein